MALTEDQDGWTVAAAGFELLTIEFSGRISLTAYADAGASCTVALGGGFEFRDPAGHRHELDADGGPWAALQPLFGLRHDVVESLHVSYGGDLRLRFRSGASIDARPDARYENWEVAGPGRLNLVCPPGGGDPRIRT